MSLKGDHPLRARRDRTRPIEGQKVWNEIIASGTVVC